MDTSERPSDARWLDEYAKRSLLSSIWAAVSNAYLWGTAAVIGQMAIKKANGDAIKFHLKKSSATIGAVALVGAAISAVTQDQVTHLERLQKQRLARKISGSDNAPPSEPLKQGELANAEKVKWREILRPTWMGGTINGKDKAFEKKWYYQYFSSRAKRSYFGAAAFGSFTAALIFSTKKLVDIAAGDKDATYHKLRTPAVTAAMIGAGSLALYLQTREESRQELLADNYLAHRIAKPGENPSSPADEALAVNTGEPIANAEASRTAQANGKWLKAYHNEHFKRSFLDGIGQATFLGMFTTFSALALDKAAEKEVPFHRTRSPLVFASLMSVGCLATYAARFNESRCVKMKDDRLAVYLHKREEKEKSRMTERKDGYWQNRIAMPSRAALLSPSLTI